MIEILYRSPPDLRASGHDVLQAEEAQPGGACRQMPLSRHNIGAQHCLGRRAAAAVDFAKTQAAQPSMKSPFVRRGSRLSVRVQTPGSRCNVSLVHNHIISPHASTTKLDNAQPPHHCPRRLSLKPPGPLLPENAKPKPSSHQAKTAIKRPLLSTWPCTAGVAVSLHSSELHAALAVQVTSRTKSTILSVLPFWVEHVDVHSGRISRKMIWKIIKKYERSRNQHSATLARQVSSC